MTNFTYESNDKFVLSLASKSFNSKYKPSSQIIDNLDDVNVQQVSHFVHYLRSKISVAKSAKEEFKSKTFAKSF